ncbi:MAG: DUF1501 domain-containing protein [Acidobacteria bacterium]|nr:DUF1501 domain-containing protein [Acidobacteriota bacterium]
MRGKEKFESFLSRHPHPHKNFFERPHVSRRRFFQALGAGLGGYYLAGNLQGQGVVKRGGATTQNKAKNVIFILLQGAISHTDTFDLKVVNGVTPSNFNPATRSGLLWPAGLLPKIGDQLPDLSIVRSVRAWALVHSLAQHWAQIGRNPVAALGDVAPNIGSIVAIEKADPSKIFPPFVALNATGAIGSGYLPASYAPFKALPLSTGLADTTNTFGQQRFETMFTRLNQLDGPLRTNSPLGKDPEDYDSFYKAAKGLMYNDAVNKAFAFSAADSQRYGNSSFGNACLVARQTLAMDQGTRYIQINFNGWDMHNDIYGQQNANGQNLYTLGRQLDDGFSEMMKDLKASGLLSGTLVVMMGEFGRTVGPLSGALGRDHFLQQFAVFAGAGVSGGRTIGSTNADGSATAEFGWSRQRDVKIEDIEATIYSALGIDWTSIRYDDPFGRGFEYVPFSGQDLYGPINELWG